MNPPSVATMRITSRRVGTGGGAGGFLVVNTDQHLALVLIEVYVGRQVRDVASELGHMVDAPGHDQVDGQAGLEPIGVAELSLLDAAAALQGAMEHFDAPAVGVPDHLLAGLLEAVDRERGEQHPREGLDPGGGILFLGQDDLHCERAGPSCSAGATTLTAA